MPAKRPGNDSRWRVCEQVPGKRKSQRPTLPFKMPLLCNRHRGPRESPASSAEPATTHSSDTDQPSQFCDGNLQTLSQALRKLKINARVTRSATRPHPVTAEWVRMAPTVTLTLGFRGDRTYRGQYTLHQRPVGKRDWQFTRNFTIATHRQADEQDRLGQHASLTIVWFIRPVDCYC